MQGTIILSAFLLVAVFAMYGIDKIFEHFHTEDPEKKKEREDKENGVI